MSDTAHEPTRMPDEIWAGEYTVHVPEDGDDPIVHKDWSAQKMTGATKYIRAGQRAPVSARGEALAIFDRLFDEHGNLKPDAPVEHWPQTIRAALQQPPAPAVDFDEILHKIVMQACSHALSMEECRNLEIAILGHIVTGKV